MCGRFANDAETNELIEEFVAAGNDYRDWIPQYSIAPTEVVPIVRERRHSDTGVVTRGVEPAVWDFKPPFLTKPGRPNFNARIETIATNGLWKSAFAGGRCIVPMRGYYEWTGDKGDKQPHFIHGPGRILAAAGISTARKEADGWVVSTAIVTREARDASGEIHDRMPAFLTPDVWDEWLNPHKLESDAEKEHLLALLTDVSGTVAATITSYEVDRRVNNSRTIDAHDATLIEPVAS